MKCLRQTIGFVLLMMSCAYAQNIKLVATEKIVKNSTFESFMEKTRENVELDTHEVLLGVEFDDKLNSFLGDALLFDGSNLLSGIDSAGNSRRAYVINQKKDAMTMVVCGSRVTPDERLDIESTISGLAKVSLIDSSGRSMSGERSLESLRMKKLSNGLTRYHGCIADRF